MSHSHLALRVSSMFMCYCAFTMRSASLVGGFLDRENKSLDGAKPTIKAVTVILSSASSTCRASLLNWDI